MKTFVICVTIMFLVDSFCSVVWRGKHVPVKFTVVSGIVSVILACWGMTVLGWL